MLVFPNHLLQHHLVIDPSKSSEFELSSLFELNKSGSFVSTPNSLRSLDGKDCQYLFLLYS